MCAVGCRDTGTGTRIAYAILNAVFREVVYLTLTWPKVDEETVTLIRPENLTSAQVKKGRELAREGSLP